MQVLETWENLVTCAKEWAAQVEHMPAMGGLAEGVVELFKFWLDKFYDLWFPLAAAVGGRRLGHC